MLSYLKKPIRAMRNAIISLKQEYDFYVPGHNEKVLLSGRDFIYDKNPYHEIFFEEIYRTNYEKAVVLDMGAHKGYFTIYALVNGASRVYSYEPAEFNFKFLEKNISRNGLIDKVFLSNSAVGRDTCERDLFIMQSSASHSLVKRADRKIVSKTRVSCISINDILAQILREKRAEEKLILKLDVEGSEYEVIPAINEEYFGSVNKFFLEYHDIPGFSQKDMSNYILSKGFKLEREISDREFLFSRI